MLEVLENNSGKISLTLIGTTLAGGAILMFGAPAFVAACVTMHTVEIITIASGIGAMAAGLSYLRRENAKKDQQEQAHDKKENASAAKLSSALKNSENLTLEEKLIALEAKFDGLSAEVKTQKKQSEIQSNKINVVIQNLSDQTISKEKTSYLAGNYSDNDSSDEDDKKDQEFNLSGQSMFINHTDIDSLTTNSGMRHRSLNAKAS